MTKAKAILSWYDSLRIPESIERALPEDVKVLNPYADMAPGTRRALEEFYTRYYDDRSDRRLILGINPGRLGAGLTGIPFTDTPALRSVNINMPDINTTETSADFVWKVIDACGGAEAFFSGWFIGGVSPLGFIRRNEKGNWVNFNYYDDPIVFAILMPFIKDQLQIQKDLAGNAGDVVILGTGKNAKAMEAINDQLNLFNSIIALEHPRFIMQYRRKRLGEFVEKFVGVMSV